jgi:hypothetical protein
LNCASLAADGVVRAIAILLAFFGAATAAAQEAHKNCKCLANKQQYEQGQVACIRGKLARCEMVLNNPSWKVLADACPETRLPYWLADNRPVPNPNICLQ